MSLFVPEMQKMCSILTGEETTVLINKWSIHKQNYHYKNLIILEFNSNMES